MSPTIKLCMVALSTAAVAGCSTPEPRPPGAPDPAPEVDDRSTSYETLEARAAYRVTMEARVAELEKRLRDMLAQIATPTEEATRQKQQALVSARRDLREAWDEFVEAPDASFDSLRSKLDRVHADVVQRIEAIARQ